MVNIVTVPTANSIAVEKWSLPPHIVASQFRIFTPVGTAMNIVAIEKAKTEIGPMPDTNMWWAHTPQPMKPIAMPENTMNEYPKMGFRLNAGITSEMMPKLGRMMMYTSG